MSQDEEVFEAIEKLNRTVIIFVGVIAILSMLIVILGILIGF